MAGQGTSRFDPDNAALRDSLAWHSAITCELQRRVLEAEKYVKSHSGDPMLMAILSGNARAKRLWEGVDTSALVGESDA